MERVLALIIDVKRNKRRSVLYYKNPGSTLPFVNRFSSIVFNLTNCIYSQIDDIAVLTDCHHQSTLDYLRNWHLSNANPKRMDILEPKHGHYASIIDALYQNISYLQKHPADTVLILDHNHVYRTDYRGMLAFHSQVDADVTLGVTSAPVKQAHEFAVVAVDSEGKVLGFSDKPSTPKGNLVSINIYIFKRLVLTKHLVEVTANQVSPKDFCYTLIPALKNHKRAFAYEFLGYQQNTDNIEVHNKASAGLTCQRASINIDNTSPVVIEDHNWLSNKPQKGTVINSIVSPGCVIRGYVENSMLESGVWVEDEAVVRNSVLKTNAVIGYHSTVDGSILMDEVNVGNFCYIGFRTTPVLVDEAITVLGKNVTVPSYTIIGRDCRIAPNIGRTDFISNTIPNCYHFPEFPASLRDTLVKNKE